MIEVKGVTKSFDDFTALDNVTCNIAEGCIYGMVGSNGAGKSTLLRVLSGIYKADKGEAIIDGINVYENTYMKNKLVFVADELFFLAGANMKSMAKFYSSIYDNLIWTDSQSLRKHLDLIRLRVYQTFQRNEETGSYNTCAFNQSQVYVL